MTRGWRMTVFWAVLASVIWWGWKLPTVGELRGDERVDTLPLSNVPGTRFLLIGTVWPTPPQVGEPSSWLISELVEVNSEGPDDIRGRRYPPFSLKVDDVRLDFLGTDYVIDEPPSREDMPQAHFFDQQRYRHGFRVGDPARVEGRIDTSGHPEARKLTAGPERLRDPSAPPRTFTADDIVFLQWVKALIVAGLFVWSVWRLRPTRKGTLKA